MIYLKKRKSKKKKYGIKCTFKRRNILPFKKIFHLWITIRLGKKRYFMGINRIKRIIKDKLYRIDEFEIYRTNKKKKYQFRKWTN